VGDLKTEVRNFSNEASCGERLVLDASDKLGYQEQMVKRYSLEPFIERFAHFGGLTRSGRAGNWVSPFVAHGSKF